MLNIISSPCNYSSVEAMEFSVTTIHQAWIAPSESTSSGILLDLSAVDTIPVLRCNARTFHVFRHGPGAARVIREALSRALVPYYPLAGRLCVSDDGQLRLACSPDDAVWFVDALADCTLDALNYLDDAMAIPYEKLLPIPPEQSADPLVQMQVTQFGCNGFVIGLVFCHTVCDGLGSAQFLNAIGEIARGAEKPSIAPQWCRDFLPPPPLPPEQPPIALPDYHLEHVNIDLSLDKIKELKREFHEWSKAGTTCSTFEIVAAMLWRQRTIAIDLDDEAPVKLVFFANCRQIVKPPLPEGFYGNCFFPVTITATSAAVTAEPVFQVVKLIQQGKAEVAQEFEKWAKRGESGSDLDPFAPPLEYSTLFISEWGRLGFMEVDYGWGKPVHIVPVQGSSIIPVGIVCSQPRPKTGVRLMTWCVQKHHLQPLLHHMMKQLN